MDRVILLREFNKFEESINGLLAFTNDGYNDDEFTSDEMESTEVELEELHHSIDIKEDIPIVDYEQDSNENILNHSNGYFQIKAEIAEETEINLEDLHHSVDIKEETLMNESQVDQDCGNPLRIHRGTHTDEKLYKCNTCSYKCSRIKIFNHHLETHTDEEPHECNIRDYESVRKVNLKKPVQTCADGKTFECKFCCYKCTTSGEYSKHQLECRDRITAFKFTASLKEKFKALLY